MIALGLSVQKRMLEQSVMILHGCFYERTDWENSISDSKVRVDNKFGKKFKEFCASVGIAVITNDPYSPEQNGKIERWHKTENKSVFTSTVSSLIPSIRLTTNFNSTSTTTTTKEGTLVLVWIDSRLHKKIVSAWKILSQSSPQKNVTGILQQYKICVFKSML